MKTFRLVFNGQEMSILIGLEMNQSEHNLKTLSPTSLSSFQIVGDSDVGGNVMLVILSCWSIKDVGDRIIMSATFFVMMVFFQFIKSVTDILNRSSTS